MILTLEITGSQAEKLGATRRKVFNATGGSIGRLPDNYWALPDPYISSRHALVRYRDGVFYIEDTSTNGVFVNSQDNRLVKGQPHALKSGDWIFIEPYEIRASITSDVKDVGPSPFDDLFSAEPGPSRSSGQSPSPDGGFGLSRSRPPNPFAPDVGIFPEPVVNEELELDPLNYFPGGAKEARRSGPTAADLASNSVLSEHYQPPSPIPAESAGSAQSGAIIPSDYDPLGSDDSPVRGTPYAHGPVPRKNPAPPVPPPVIRSGQQMRGGARLPPGPAAQPAAGEDHRDAVDLGAVLEGAGIHDVAVTPELARSFGQILRVVVGGVMDVLQARQRIKSEFRIGMTTFKPADNNPLKFSANVDDALHNLLVKRNAAYLGPVDAFEDAFDDVRNHQVAMLAGLRVAFEAMLAEFDPERLQADFDRQLKKGALVSVPAKLRYWELYRAKVHDMVRDSERCFRELFGDEFARAYEEQLKRLKAQSRPPKP